jgi:hypothetical protein
MFRRPAFGFAEIAWRWSFGATVFTLLAFSFLEYLDTLPVTRGDLFLLQTRQAFLIARAIEHILSGSAVRVIEAAVVMAVGLALAWIMVASLGRAATLKSLLAYFQTESAEQQPPSQSEAGDSKPGEWRLSPLLGLNFLRVAVTFSAVIGCLAALVLAGLASPAHNPLPAVSFLVFSVVLLLVWVAWHTVSWFLSVAAIFVVRDGKNEDKDTFGALAAAVGLFRDRSGPVLAASTWFGLAHLVAFFLATVVVAFPLAFAGIVPPGFVLLGVLFVTCVYFAVVDFLHIGRLAAYVAICQWPEAPPVPAIRYALPGPGQRSSGAIARGRVDPDEVILSDVPAT